MAKFWWMALALVMGAGLWAAPAMAQSNESGDSLDSIQRGGAEGSADTTLGKKGLVFTTDGFELRVTTRVQFRLTYQNEVGNGNSGTNGRDFVNFRIRRAKTTFSGHIFQKEFQYKLQLSWASGGTNIIEEAWFRWAVMQYINVNAGQEKLNFNWEEKTSSGNLQFVDRSYVNAVFNEGYAKGIWIDGQIGEDISWLKYVIGVYNGALRGQNDFRNNDLAINADVFSNTVDGEMMLNLRLETHPLGDVAHGMNDMRGEDEYSSVLFAIGVGVNYFQSRFNDPALRADSVFAVTPGDSPTASGRFRTGHSTWTMTIDGHFRWHGLSVDVALFYRNTDFHNFGRNNTNVTNFKAGIGDLTDIAWTFEVAYFILPQQFNVGIRVNNLDADDFWGGSDNRSLGVMPDVWEAGLSANYYIQGNNLKVTFDLLMVFQQVPQNGSTTGIRGAYNAPPARVLGGGTLGSSEADHNDLWIIRLQLQWIF